MSKFPSPQWGGNSKGKVSALPNLNERFRPRNGEIILKWMVYNGCDMFPSPRWGSNSKKAVSRDMSQVNYSFPSP